MIVILRQDGIGRSMPASRHMWEAIHDLSIPAVVVPVQAVGADTVVEASGLILCDLDGPATRRAIGKAASRRVGRPLRVVAAIGASARTLATMPALSGLLPAVVLSFPWAWGPAAWRAVALKVSSKVFTLQACRASAKSAPDRELIQTEVS